MRHCILILGSCLLQFVLLGTLSAQEGASDSNGSLFFKGVNLFDGEQVVGTTNVLIEDGKIAAVGAEVSPDKNSVVVDGSGKTLLPGMIDCHVHVWFDAQLKQAAMFGVTTELDMMSSPPMMRMLRSRQKRGKANNRADVFSAGAAVTVKGGHGTQFGMPVPTVAKAEDIPGFVRARVKEGSDYIKLIYEDGSAYGFTRPTLNEDMFAAAVSTAHDSEKLAVAHVSTADGASLAFRNGIDGLVHLFANEQVDSSMIKAAKDAGVFVVPTAAVVSNTCGANTTAGIIKDKNLRKMLTNENLTNLAKSFPTSDESTNSWENLKQNIAELHKAGVPILAGTDSPNPGTVHGVSMHHELRLLVDAGLSPVEALASATSKPADCFKLADRGRIKVGLRADVFLVNGDPTKDIAALAKIDRVWKAGIPIDTKKRLATVAEEIERASRKRVLAKKDRLVSSFETDEGDSPTASFGTGWQTSTDSMMGGDSKCRLVWSDEGAANSKGCLKVSGKCRASQPRFAGAMFFPGSTPMAPADINPHRGISFSSKGDGTVFRIMVFTTKGGFMPATKSFKAGKDWTDHAFEFKDFNGCDGSDITGIWFGSDSSGDFNFQIDEVKLTK